MFGLKIIVHGSRVGAQRSLLPFRALTLCRCALTRTAYLIALMARAIEERFAYTGALRRILMRLVAGRFGGRPSTSASDVHSLHTGHTIPCVAYLLVVVATSEHSATWLLALRDWIYTAVSWFLREPGERCLPAWTVSNNIGRAGTVFRFQCLHVALFLAMMLATIELPTADVTTFEGSSPALGHRFRIGRFVLFAALPFFSAIVAKNVFFNLPTVTPSRNPSVTDTT